MRAGPSLRLSMTVALLGYGATAGLAWRCERSLRERPARPPAQSSGDGGEAVPSGATQRLGRAGDSYFAEYGFTNFNKDLVKVMYQIPQGSYAAYCAGFWYSKADIDAIEAWHNNARNSVYKLAVSTKKTQAQLDTAVANLKAERDRKLKDYLATRGFRLKPGNVVESDVPQIVQRSAAQLKPMALAVDRVASARAYDSENVVGAVTAMVQTAIRYKIPPSLEGGRHTGGLLPPVMSVVRGWGDCDTKTALLGSVLANWPNIRMVGIAVPEHYLMGVLRLPRKGDVFVDYQGLRYVLIEPAGPAWLPPGTVGVDTLPMLQAASGFKVEPFSAPAGGS